MTDAGNVELIITDNSLQVKAAMEDALLRGLEACGALAEGYAKQNLTEGGTGKDGTSYDPHVDTGALRNSIAHAMGDGHEVLIGTNLYYAPYVELGTGIYASNGQGRKTGWFFQDRRGEWHPTRGIRPAHFLLRAIAEHTEEYEQVITESLKNA